MSDRRETTSRMPGFHRLSVRERQGRVAEFASLSGEDLASLASESPLSLAAAAQLTENTVGIHALPLGVALNFLVNGRDVLVPMVTEEPSVIAAAGNAARLARDAGGFIADVDPSIMIAQVQLVELPDAHAARDRIVESEARIRARIDEIQPGMARRGGGARGVEARVVEAPLGRTFLVVHLLVDVGDAMGANAVNTIAEGVAPLLAEITGGRAHLRILSNLTDRRCARAEVAYRLQDLATEEMSGPEVGRAVELASLFAEADPHRAATHNKGIMNGIDAVALATGNDWRALEAGAHAFAARDGRYTALSTWRVDGDRLLGRLEVPLAVGTVGATVEGNARARIALRLLGARSARQLAEIMAAVGLAQNFGALRALATEGIQRGHMTRHARAVAAAAGADPGEVEALADDLVAAGDVKITRARELLAERRRTGDRRSGELRPGATSAVVPEPDAQDAQRAEVLAALRSTETSGARSGAASRDVRRVDELSEATEPPRPVRWLRPASASAGGKAILLGEHAVVHGRPALAVGLSRRVSVQVRPQDGPLRAIPSDDERVRRAVETAAAAVAIAPDVGFAIEVSGNLPVAVGLGSSAALSVALVRALAASAGMMLSAVRLDEIAYELERIFHGTPSGVDAAAAAQGSALWFEIGPPRRVETVILERSLTFVVALTGSRHETSRTVGSVRERAAAHPDVYGPVLDAIGKLVVAARGALEKGDWPRLGRLMTMNHELLRALGVSTAELDELVARAVGAGAYGAKLTGGGGGGAAVILAGDDPTPVVEALRAAGYEAFVQRIEANQDGAA